MIDALLWLNSPSTAIDVHRGFLSWVAPKSCLVKAPHKRTPSPCPSMPFPSFHLSVDCRVITNKLGMQMMPRSQENWWLYGCGGTPLCQLDMCTGIFANPGKTKLVVAPIAH